MGCKKITYQNFSFLEIVHRKNVTAFKKNRCNGDHLGNVRLTYSDTDNNGSIDASTEIISEKNYYPFGLKHKGYNNVVSANSNSVAQKFGYNGKELNDELGLNWHDFDARNYDASLGRWMNLDPLAEDMRRFSPYAFGFNNPIYYIDPDGMMPIGIGGMDEEKNFDFNDFDGPQHITSTVVDNEGKIIDYKDDGDNNIYLNERGLDNVIGTEREGVDYNWIGERISNEDLNDDYSLVTITGNTFIAGNLKVPAVTMLEVPWYLGGGGAWKTGRLFGFFARLKMIWNGGTAKITVQILANVEKTSSLAKVLKAVEAEAKSAGAKKLVIEGVDILNSKLLNASVFKRFGYTVEKVTETTIKIVKDLK